MEGVNRNIATCLATVVEKGESVISPPVEGKGSGKGLYYNIPNGKKTRVEAGIGS